MNWPDQAHTVAEQALDQVDLAYTNLPHEREAIASKGDAFDRSLAQLAKQVDSGVVRRAAGLESQSEIAKLIVMAHHRGQHPQRYEAIRDLYLTRVKDPQRIAPSAPPLRSEHIDEDYRLVWEHYLLRPPVRGAVFKSQRRIVDALVGIGNPSSVLTVTRAYAATTGPEVPLTRNLGNTQRQFMQVLGRMPGPESLQGLLQSVALSRQQIQRVEQDRRAAMLQRLQFNAEDYALRLLTDKERFGTAQQWRQVLNTFPAKATSPAGQELLNQARAFYKNFPANGEPGKEPVN